MSLRHYNDLTLESDTGASKDGTHRLIRPAVEAAPTAATSGIACLLAWQERGSVAAPDWLGYALAVVFLLTAVTLVGAPRRPGRAGLLGIAGLAGLAVWAAASASWAPLPSLARDEALLTALYAAVLAIPLLTLATARGRIWALAAVSAALGLTALATAIRVGWGADPVAAYAGVGRLYFPISYVNAQASFALVAFWPALSLAARRSTPAVLRALALAAATSMLGVGTLTQSRGAVVALVASGLIVLAVLPSRLRLAVAASIPFALVAIEFRRLTAPFQAQFESPAELAAAIPPAGQAVVWLTAVGLGGGLVYALIDARLPIGDRTRVVIGRTAALLFVAALAIGAGVVLNRIDEPREALQARWQEFKHEPTAETAGTHFFSPGSNRYDFWRVALGELRDNPVAGGGARSFGAIYLQERESPETPTRVHSLPLETLAEQGIVGGLLLALALAAPLVVLVRRRARGPAAAALAAATFWLVHAAVDWTWTFPAVGIPFFLLLGIGAGGNGVRVRTRAHLVAGGVCLVVALLAFAPPWLSARYVDTALGQGLPAGADSLGRARRLDPLSSAPYFAQAQLVTTPTARVQALEGAVAKEPRSVRAQYVLGLALLDAGRKADAREALERAAVLFPGEPLIQAALRRARAS